YHIHSVVGAGVGGGQYDIPEHINVVSVRNRLDPVTYIGGAPDGAIDVRGTWVRGAHSLDHYVEFTRGQGGDELEAWVANLGLTENDHVQRTMYSGQVGPAEQSPADDSPAQVEPEVVGPRP